MVKIRSMIANFIECTKVVFKYIYVGISLFFFIKIKTYIKPNKMYKIKDKIHKIKDKSAFLYIN